MNPKLQMLPFDERIRLVEDLWDSIASDQQALALTTEQKAELDRRLDAYELDKNRGQLATDVVSRIRHRL
jgi:putative addiction module component (TIGR02574 family)